MKVNYDRVNEGRERDTMAGNGKRESQGWLPYFTLFFGFLNNGISQRRRTAKGGKLAHVLRVREKKKAMHT